MDAYFDAAVSYANETTGLVFCPVPVSPSELSGAGRARVKLLENGQELSYGVSLFFNYYAVCPDGDDACGDHGICSQRRGVDTR